MGTIIEFIITLLSLALNIALTITIFSTHKRLKEMEEKVIDLKFEIGHIKSKIDKNFPE